MYRPYGDENLPPDSGLAEEKKKAWLHIVRKLNLPTEMLGPLGIRNMRTKGLSWNRHPNSSVFNGSSGRQIEEQKVMGLEEPVSRLEPTTIRW